MVAEPPRPTTTVPPGPTRRAAATSSSPVPRDVARHRVVPLGSAGQRQARGPGRSRPPPARRRTATRPTTGVPSGPADRGRRPRSGHTCGAGVEQSLAAVGHRQDGRPPIRGRWPPRPWPPAACPAVGRAPELVRGQHDPGHPPTPAVTRSRSPTRGRSPPQRGVGPADGGGVHRPVGLDRRPRHRVPTPPAPRRAAARAGPPPPGRTPRWPPPRPTSGTRTGRPDRSASDPPEGRRPGTAARPAAAGRRRPRTRPPSASRASSSPHTTPSTAARARSSRVTPDRRPASVPVAVGRSGVRSPSKYGRRVRPRRPGRGGQGELVEARRGSPRAARPPPPVTRVAFSVQARGRKPPVASANPATVPVGSATGPVAAGVDGARRADRDARLARGRGRCPSAAAMLSPVPGPTRPDPADVEAGRARRAQRSGGLGGPEHGRAGGRPSPPAPTTSSSRSTSQVPAAGSK